MKKKILIILTGPRIGGNSETLAREFARGALDSGNEVEIERLSDKNINFCSGCLACQRELPCIHKDDMSMLLDKLSASDTVVYVTPIYFYEMTGQMKTFIDRTNPLFPKENKFKDVYLITSAADESISAIDGAIKGLEGCIDCFEDAKLAGVIKGVGLESYGDINNKELLLENAYQMGKEI